MMTGTVLAEYLFATSGSSYTPWQLKGVAVAGYTIATLRQFNCHAIHLIPIVKGPSC